MEIFGSSFLAFVSRPMAEVRGTGGMVSQAEEGMKLFVAQHSLLYNIIHNYVINIVIVIISILLCC